MKKVEDTNPKARQLETLKVCTFEHATLAIHQIRPLIHDFTAEAGSLSKKCCWSRQVLVRRDHGKSAMRFYDIQAGKVLSMGSARPRAVKFMMPFRWSYKRYLAL